MRTAIVVASAWVLLAGVLCLADRLLLKMEARGWIYYRKKRGASTRLGQAALELQAILEPSKQHVVEERSKEARGEHDQGDPPLDEPQADGDGPTVPRGASSLHGRSVGALAPWPRMHRPWRER